MNKLSPQERAQVLGCLVEGNSIRATVRLTGAAKNTVTKLLVDVGKACREYQDKALRNLPCKRIQVDEVWAFCYAKQKNLPPEKAGQFGYGDVWTWTAICADTKLVPSWMVGDRDTEWASAFMNDLAGRLADRVQLTSDGHRPYLQAVAGAFGNEIDYAMLDKLYGMPDGYEGKYSPAKCLGSRKRVVSAFLPIAEDLGRAVAAASAPAAGDAAEGLIEGVRLIQGRFSQELAAQGVVPIQAVGERFDPSLHEALLTREVSDPSQDGMVVEELGQGYRLGEEVIRPSRVAVGKLRAEGAAPAP